MPQVSSALAKEGRASPARSDAAAETRPRRTVASRRARAPVVGLDHDDAQAGVLLEQVVRRQVAGQARAYDDDVDDVPWQLGRRPMPLQQRVDLAQPERLRAVRHGQEGVGGRHGDDGEAQHWRGNVD